MVLSTCISLYTSRVVLEVLGVDDFGVYGVVGGVVAMFGFLNASMSKSTSRFITFELGRGNFKHLKDTFSATFAIHLAIGLLVVLLGETVGLWFLNYKLNIPSESMYAAHWVFQLSLLSMLFSVTQVPYAACIMAHEKMGIYAYIELLRAGLKLLIVYLLIELPGQKLIEYALLTTSVDIIILLLSRFYSIRHFDESHLSRKINRRLIRPLLSFTGFNLFFTACIAARQQGGVFITNMFFGVALNAASSIAATVTGVVGGLYSSISAAFFPQITKLYAAGEIEKSQNMAIRSFVFTSLVAIMLMIPVINEIDFVLNLWLVKVPAYVSIFVKISLIVLFVDLFNVCMNVLIQATGNIKNIVLTVGMTYLLQLPAMWYLFKFTHDPTSSYYLSIVVMLLVLAMNISAVKINIKNINIRRIITYCIRCFISAALSLITVTAIMRLLCPEQGWRGIFLSGFLSVPFCLLYYYIIAFDEASKIFFRDKMKSVYKRVCILCK